ncbi:MAG: hypothetical protein RID23_05420 [Roseovarius sp.]
MQADAAQILMREYFELQAIYESYNAQSLTIKEWSVSIGIAALLAAYARPVSEAGGRAGVILAALVAVPFYLTDALWKSFQMAYLPRLQAIEGGFRDAAVGGEIAIVQGLVPLQGVASWSAAYGSDPVDADAGKVDLFLEALTSHAVLLPHVVLLGLGLFMAVVFPPRLAAAATERRERR